jgi:hypothetical protein
MSILGALGRAVWLGTVRCLCSKYGPACVLAGTFALGSSAALYLSQPSTQADSRPTAAQVGHALRCGSFGMGYFPGTNQFYCVPYGG